MLTSAIEPSNDSGKFFSVLLFFSYPNGTDFYMNISPYVNNSGYYTGSNLISYLISKRTIDNNIFDYEGINEIKLISIPSEILFYRSSDLNTPLTNGEQIGPEHVLDEDKDIIKYDRNYILDYQYMAKDKASYNDMYNQVHDKDNGDGHNPSGSYYSQKIYYYQ
jgi:hypothetical protein